MRTYQPISSTRKRLALGLTVGVLTSVPALAQANEAAWLEYQAAEGCPRREILIDELLRRRSMKPPSGSERLRVKILFEEGNYLAQIRFGDGESAAMRAVSHSSCDQVVHAAALIAALMLDGQAPEGKGDAEPKDDKTAPPRAARIVPEPPHVLESSSVTTPPQTQKASTTSKPRPIRAFTFGPTFLATMDGMAAPAWRFGPRVGAVLSTHRLLNGSQQWLRMSFAHVRSGTIAADESRTANITWTSVRLDVCHGSNSQRLSSWGGCAWFDVGRWQGQGRVANSAYERGTYWSRAGVGLFLRQKLVGGLSLLADAGVMLPFSRPEFYFAASGGEPRRSIHRPGQLGPVADLGLELHFW